MFKILLRIIQNQNHRKRRALVRAEIHFGRSKTLQNHEKTQIAGLEVQIHNSHSIWLINGPNRIGRSQSVQASSGSDTRHRRSAIADDQIDGSHQQYRYKHQWHCDCDIAIPSGLLIACTDQQPRSHRQIANRRVAIDTFKGVMAMEISD